MGTTTAADWKVYNDQVQAAYAERAAQAIDLILKLGSALVIEDAAVPGDYRKGSFFKFPSGLVSRRDTTSDSAATAVTAAQGESADVRLSRKIGPVDVTFDALRRTGITPDTFSMFLGEQIADGVIQAWLNDALRAAAAALSASATQLDITGDTDKTLKREALVGAMAKLGDAGQDVVAWVMHSKAYFDLLGKDIAPTTSVDSLVSGVSLYGAQPGTLGRPVLVTDCPALALAGPTYRTLGLTAGALRVALDSQLTVPVVQTITGNENLKLRIQGERDWLLGLKGFAWDVANGGANPNDTALGTQSNWDLAASSVKFAAGVAILSQ